MYQLEGKWYYWYMMDYMGIVSVTGDFPYHTTRIYHVNESPKYLSRSKYNNDYHVIIPYTTSSSGNRYGTNNIRIRGYQNQKTGLAIGTYPVPNTDFEIYNPTRPTYEHGCFAAVIYPGAPSVHTTFNNAVRNVYQNKELTYRDKYAIESFLESDVYKNNFNKKISDVEYVTSSLSDKSRKVFKDIVGSNYPRDIDSSHVILKRIPGVGYNIISGNGGYDEIHNLLNNKEFRHAYFPDKVPNPLGSGDRTIEDGYLLLLCFTIGITGRHQGVSKEALYRCYDIVYVIRDNPFGITYTNLNKRPIPNDGFNVYNNSYTAEKYPQAHNIVYGNKRPVLKFAPLNNNQTRGVYFIPHAISSSHLGSDLYNKVSALLNPNSYKGEVETIVINATINPNIIKYVNTGKPFKRGEFGSNRDVFGDRWGSSGTNYTGLNNTIITNTKDSIITMGRLSTAQNPGLQIVNDGGICIVCDLITIEKARYSEDDLVILNVSVLYVPEGQKQPHTV